MTVHAQSQTWESAQFEARLARGHRTFLGRTNKGAALGVRSLVNLRNPPGSGILVVVEQVFFSVQDVLVETAITGTPAFANQGTIISLDQRFTGAALATIDGTQGPAVTPAAFYFPVTVWTGTFGVGFLTVQLVLSPGTVFVVQTPAENEALAAGFVWRELAA